MKLFLTVEEREHIRQIMTQRGIEHCALCRRIHEKLTE